MDIKRIIKEYYEQLYAHKFAILDKMDQFLERHNIPELTQGEVDSMTMCVSTKKVESQINNVPKQKVQGPDVFTGDLLNI